MTAGHVEARVPMEEEDVIGRGRMRCKRVLVDLSLTSAARQTRVDQMCTDNSRLGGNVHGLIESL